MRRILMALAVMGALAPAGASGAVLARWDEPRKDLDFEWTGTRVVGPVLAGDRVVWARGDLYRSWTIEAAPGGVVAPLGLQGRKPGPDGTYHVLALAGSPTRLAYLEQFEDPGDKAFPTTVASGRVAAGAPDAEPRTVVACHDVGAVDGLDDQVGLAGDVLAFDDPCGGPGMHALDLGSGASWSAPGGLNGGLWTAGRSIALGTTLHDAATGAVRGTYPPLAGDPGIRDAAVQDDGTEAIETYKYPRRLLVRAPGDAAPRVVPLDRPFVGAHGNDVDLAPSVRIAGGRIAVRVRAADGAQQLALTGVDGRTRPVVDFGRPTAARPAAEPLWWSYDGTRIAWASRSCARISIGVTTIRAGAAPERVPRSVCPYARVVSRTARVDRHGRFALRVVCGAPCRDVLHLSYGGDPYRHNAVRFALPGSTRPQLVHTRLPRGATLRNGVGVRIDSYSEGILATDVTLLRARASSP
jgi:hypothetical protein